MLGNFNHILHGFDPRCIVQSSCQCFISLNANFWYSFRVISLVTFYQTMTGLVDTGVNIRVGGCRDYFNLKYNVGCSRFLLTMRNSQKRLLLPFFQRRNCTPPLTKTFVLFAVMFYCFFCAVAVTYVFVMAVLFRFLVENVGSNLFIASAN